MESPFFIFFVITIVTALLFDLINGFHDAANSIATVVSTRVLKPQTAVLWAAFFNFIAMLIFSPRVAETVSKIVIIQENDPVYYLVIFSGLIGAILWNLLTWWLALPTSSSHALIGGLSGAGMAHAGMEAIRWDMLENTFLFIVLSPILGFFIGAACMIALFNIFKNTHPAAVDALFRKGQLFSAALYSIGHGANDAQKTMGVILALLIAKGTLSKDTELSLFNIQTLWIILSCQFAMAFGTALGGWKIVKTMGMKITKLKPIGGFSAESAGAITLFLATHLGVPVSTTQTIAGALMGVGSVTTKFSNIKWGIATKIVWTWILTIPAAGLIAAACLYLLKW